MCVSSAVLSVIQGAELATDTLFWENLCVRISCPTSEVRRVHTHMDALLQLRVVRSLPGPACHMHLNLLHNK